MKATQNLLAFLFCVFCFIIKANAQISKSDSCGIYHSFLDYQQHHFIYPVPTHRNGYTIWPQGFFTNKDIELKSPDTTIVYKRSDIWGYTDHRDRLIRIFSNKHYRVMCEKGVVVYIIYSPTRTSYHFSKSLNDPIYCLTKKNLLKIYADDKKNLEKIKSTKKKDWFIWDKSSEQYLLNRLFLELN